MLAVRAGLCFLILAFLRAAVGREVTNRYQDNVPRPRVSEDATYFSLVLGRRPAYKRLKLRGERTKARIADLQADFGYSHLARSQQTPSTVHAQCGKEIVRCLAEGSAKEAVKVER